MISLSMLIPLLCVIHLVIDGANGLNNGLGLTPPMGWNSWNRFNCNIDENLIKDTADAIVKYGLDKVGYKYVNMDDCWQGDRGNDGRLTFNQTTFPGGIKAIADHVHSLGLLFGIYSDAGTLTCENKPGSLGHEKDDAMTFVSWGIDYLKYDNCFDGGVPIQQRYEAMRDALNATGKHVYYSLCEWGVNDPSEWGNTVGNSWRTTVDIYHSWDSVLFTLGKQRGITQHGGPGGWNDPDMLQVGNGDLTVDEQKSHFSLWAALKAPLLLGFDIRNTPSDTLDIVKNQEIIAINQDPLGRSVDFIDTNYFDAWETWAGELSDGYVAVLLNRGESPATLTFNFSSLKLEGKYNVRDLWEHQDKGVYANSYSSQVARHGVAVLKLTPTSFAA